MVVEVPPGVLGLADDAWMRCIADLGVTGADKGKESNWIQTVPGKGWFTILRLYGALEPWFDKTWRPGEIEAVR
jgi:hypothetical protein